GPGITLYINEKGGRVAIIVPSCFNFHRQVIVQNVIRYLYKNRVPFPIVSGSAYLLPMLFRKGEEDILVVFNGNTDPAFVNIEYHNKQSIDAVLLKPLDIPCSYKLLKRNEKNNYWETGTAVPYMSFLVIKNNTI
ncbi:MAG: hypothetical protein PHI44_03630, partial [Candidatus Ratteibacteria bacterium]|nr:hypothetical protein [Candidatus Ratteibacteria bacterium]